MPEAISKETGHVSVTPVSPQASEDRPAAARVEYVNEKELNVLAQNGGQAEHHLGPMAAVKAYPMAIFWSVMVSMCVVMEGYEYVGRDPRLLASN
jgi:hypothetical protein